MSLKRQPDSLLSMTNTTAFKSAATTMKGQAGSTVIKAIEKAYAAVRKNNPDLPEVLFVTGTGLMGTGAKWGHYGADRWVVQDGMMVDAATGALPEIFIAGERLECGAADTFATIVHEAVHALATVRGIKDTSRGFRYHNKRFVALAEELGMEWPEGKKPHTSIGFSAVVLREDTLQKYAKVIATLEQAIVAHLDTFKKLGLIEGGDSEGEDEGGESPTIKKAPGKPASRSNLKGTCDCEEPRIIRASATVWEGAPIVCDDCGANFTVKA